MAAKAPAKTAKAAPKKSAPAIASPQSAESKRWQAEDDVRTLMRAEEIKKDRNRLTMAGKVAKEQADNLAKVAAGNKAKK